MSDSLFPYPVRDVYYEPCGHRCLTAGDVTPSVCGFCGEGSPVANKVSIALACGDAMREYRKDKPIAFQPRTRP